MTVGQGGAPAAAIEGSGAQRRFGGFALQEYALVIVVVLLFVAGAILKPDSFPTWDNVRNMLTQASVVGVLAMGMTFVIATSGIDLSVGSVLAAAGMFGGILVDPEGSTLLFIVGRGRLRDAARHGQRDLDLVRPRGAVHRDARDVLDSQGHSPATRTTSCP